MRILGIDPGVTGALALVDDGIPIAVEDMPVMAKFSGKGSQVNGSELSTFILTNQIDRAIVEQVNAFPGEGVVGAFSFGHTVGIIHGVLAALQIPMILTTPQSWKRRAGILTKGKEAARSKCIVEYPSIADRLTRKTKDVGRADAILIAIYGVKK